MIYLNQFQITLILSFQTALFAVCFVFNVWSPVVVFKYRIFPSPFTKLLMQSQFIFDAMICFITPIMLWITEYLYRVYHTFNVFLCYMWWLECIYWMVHSCSNQSLVWITVDRYLAIIYPTM